MPREWIEELSESAAECRDDLIFKLLEQIPSEHSNLARALTKIVEEFRYDHIFKIAQSTLNKSACKHQV